ncbi:MAG: hypothetical protein KIT31_29765 [Deltaproteobacteria bacterium]|nr:hypothetical protein [Deltaproteobacteria bacterium]
MTQVPLFAALHLLGVALCLAFGPRRRPILCAALGFPIGLAAMVALVLALLAAGVFNRATGVLAIAACIGGCVWRLRRAWPDRATWIVLAGWTAGFLAVVAALTRYNWSILTYDSHYILMMGGILADDGGFAPKTLEYLGDYGIFVPVAQALQILTPENHLWGLAPVLAATTIAAFGVLLAQSLDALGVRFRGRNLAVALVAAATFSSYMLFRHSFYIHTNFGTAAYLMLFCGLFWLAEVEEAPGDLPVLFFALVGIALHRIEGVLICILFLALAVLPSRLPRRTLLGLVAAWSAAIVGWHVLLASGMSPTSQFLTPSRCYTLAGLSVAFLAYAALPFPRLHRAAPAIVAAAFTLGLAGAFALRTSHMTDSAVAWGKCLMQAPYWKGTWPVILGFAAIGLARPAPRHRWLFVIGVPAYLALILLLSWGRDPYYFGLGDSGSRMAMHLVPLAFFYLGLKFIPELMTRR